MVVSETLEVSAETDVESEDMLPPYCVNKNSEDSESLKDIEDDCDTSRTSKEDDKEVNKNNPKNCPVIFHYFLKKKILDNSRWC